MKAQKKKKSVYCCGFLANWNGDGWDGLLYGCIFYENIAFEGRQTEKKRILWQRWRTVGGGSLHPGWCRLTSWRWWRWYVLSQRVIKYRFYWYILMVVSVILYRCTFVPRDGDGLRAGTGTDGRRAGGQREGRREAIPPPR